MANEKSVFDTLNAIDVSGFIEKKNGLSYLSWSHAWGFVKKNYPDATYTIYEDTEAGTNYFTDIKLKGADKATAWVKTGVTINGLECIEMLPVMDFKNKSIPLPAITSFDVNKAIQRSLTKALARHGLGLYVYAGEDLPQSYDDPASILENIIKEVQSAKDAKELTAVWKKYSTTFAKDSNEYKSLAQAVAKSPVNPNRK